MSSYYSDGNVCWPRRVMPPGESRWICADGTDRQTDGRTPDRHIIRVITYQQWCWRRLTRAIESLDDTRRWCPRQAGQWFRPAWRPFRQSFVAVTVSHCLACAGQRPWCPTSSSSAHSPQTKLSPFDRDALPFSALYLSRVQFLPHDAMLARYMLSRVSEWMNEWKREDFKCVWKPTESRLCLTHYVNKSSRWAK